MTTTNQPKKLFQKIPVNRIYKKDYKVPPMEVTVSIAGEAVGANETFIIYSGLPKQGKSLYISATVASYFLKEAFFSIKLDLKKDKPNVCLIDTENGIHNFYKNIGNIKKFANGSFDETRFEAYRLRGMSTEYILTFITEYIDAHPQTGCLIIDGLLDCVKNSNDVSECTLFSSFLKKITDEKNVFILGVLHTNRGGENTTGHLGSILDRAANAVLLIKKNKEAKTFELHPILLRDAKNDFDPIAIKFFEDSGFMQVDIDKPTKPHTYKDWTDKEHYLWASQLIKEKGESYGDIIETMRERLAIGVNACKNIFKYWIEKNIVSKRSNNLYYSELKK